MNKNNINNPLTYEIMEQQEQYLCGCCTCDGLQKMDGDLNDSHNFTRIDVGGA